MSRRNNPDHELDVMRRGLRVIAELSPAGRRRVLAYWCARAEIMPDRDDQSGPQQLDIEDVPMMPLRVKSAAS